VFLITYLQGFLLVVLNVGPRLVSYERNFIWLLFTLPRVASLVFQLVLEPIRSLVILNRLCDPKVAWRKALSSLWFSMVKILVMLMSDMS
jgi:hypothetical protein